MTFDVRELPRARADKQGIAERIASRSREGARAWLDAYDDLLARLSRNPSSFGWADEGAELDRDIRQALFKTRRGRTYRAVFLVENETVYVLRIRGPGQAPLTDDEL